MGKLIPWYKVVTPREDLREGRPLDASEFAVHLDQVRDGRANEDYQNPTRFFKRTFLTKSLGDMAGEILRRLSGIKTETSAVFNMSTQFGGGKTHALTLLYHLFTAGSKAQKWQGVNQIITKSGVNEIPRAATAVFVGTEFDSIQGRGGNDGTPNRKTPWGEIAFQLLGEDGFNEVAEHDKKLLAPGGDVIRKFIPKNVPSLILIDELMNYINRNRKSGLSSQLQSFIQNLSEEARGSDKVVLVVSIPASEFEMSSEDQSDYKRFKKLLNRLGKAVIMAAETETSEIIRRRLFEWDPRAVSQEGKVLLPREAFATCSEYAGWLNDNRPQIPNWFSIDHAKETFEATYPFHPMVLSVFERKWQELPRFQRTRGILRILALWVSNAYQQGFKGAHRDTLIEMGSAPLEDPQFRSAVFEQLGESRLEGALTTDICGKKDAHAVRLDEDAVETIKKARLHKKVATSIFFESNGGQTKDEATLPEIRLAVAGPELDLGNVETALDGLTEACYYLEVKGNRYRFSLKENLKKRHADRKASVKDQAIDEILKEKIQEIFPRAEGVERIFFPDKSGQIPDRPVITLIVLGPDQAINEEPSIMKNVETMTREYGKSARTYKSALIWIVPDSAEQMREEARKYIAWENIAEEGLRLDEVEKKELDTSIKRSKRDLIESVWRSYKSIVLLDKENKMKVIDLGLVTSSAAESMTQFILARLRQSGEIEKDISPRFLVRNWPPAFKEWNTQSVRDAFYSSPKFPRLLYSESIKQTIARGVCEEHIAYVGKSPKGEYDPFIYKKPLDVGDVEISEDMFLLTAEEAEKHLKPPKLTKLLISPSQTYLEPGNSQTFSVSGLDQFGNNMETGEIKWNATGGEIDKDGVFKAGEELGNFIVNVEVGKVVTSAGVTIREKGAEPIPPATKKKRIYWSGEISPQKWTNFYMKVLTKLVGSGSVKLNIDIDATPDEGVTDQQVEEIKAALRGLGLNDDVKDD